jgi:hypothetical protein
VAEAGWYADPADPARVRWWDGAAWTPEVREALVAPPVAASTLEHIALEPAAPATPTFGSITAPTVGATTATLERPSAPTAAPAPAAPAAHEAPPAPTAVTTPTAPVLPHAERPPVASTHTAPAHPAGPTPLISWDSQGAATAPPTRPGAATAGFGSATVAAKGGGRGFPWVRTLVVLVLVGALGAAAVVFGLPIYQARAAAIAAGELAPVLAQNAPAKLGGQKLQKARAAEAATLATALRADGAAWAWAGVYGNRADTSIYLVGELSADDRALAMQAQTDPDKAAELIRLVGAGMVAGAGGQLTVGTTTEYGSEVGGKTWCAPITVGGVGGGHCLWTNGREMLQLVNVPSIEALAAKHTLAALRQLDTTR